MRRLSEVLVRLGASVDVLALGSGDPPKFDSVTTINFPADAASFPGLSDLLFSRSMRRHLFEAVEEQNCILHSNGLWRMPNVYPGTVARKRGAPLIVSPHGMLGAGALQFSRTKKRIFSFLAQRRALDAVSCFHATSVQEYNDIREYGLASPVAIIPNGIDIPPAKSKQLCPRSRRNILYLGRVHPKKGIDRLIKAWACLEPDHADWDLRIVGPSEGGHGEELVTLALRLGLKRVEFHAGLYGEERDAAYREADLFVLPTLDENFAMVVAEALAHGTPVICSKGAPWADLETHGCGWWVDHGAEPIEFALRQAMSMPREVLGSMGQRGRAWMAQDFSWTRSARDMMDVYEWCLGGAEIPQSVRRD